SDIRNGWMAVVAAIFRALGAPQAVWSSEWCGMHAEDVATFDEVTTFVEANPHLRAPELENLKAAQYFLQPIA
ncbi:MAG: hypothetical protein KDD11_21030, partial [Acidobacteria bacterium]|nr:hypothetical protein [Acidobacteriota bacterium]